LVIEVATSISSESHPEAGAAHKLAVIRVNNGPEFTSADFVNWCRKKENKMHFNQPGKPMQNGYIERFNGSYQRHTY
jgi:putative transposase